LLTRTPGWTFSERVSTRRTWTLRRRFYEALDAGGLLHLRDAEAPLRWHELRHTFASLLERFAAW